MGMPDHLTCLLRNLYAGQEQQLEPHMEQWTGSKLGREYVKAVYCHSSYLTPMQSVCVCVCVCARMHVSMYVLSHVKLFVTPRTVACQAPLSMARILEWVAISFSIYAEYIMQNAKLDEAQTGIKIAGRNINNLRYADDTTLMAETEEELKSLLMKVKEESEKAALKLNIQKTKIMASGPITSWQIDGKKWKQW